MSGRVLEEMVSEVRHFQIQRYFSSQRTAILDDIVGSWVGGVERVQT